MGDSACIVKPLMVWSCTCCTVIVKIMCVLNPSIAAAVCTTPCSCNSNVVYMHGDIQADNRMNTLIIIAHVNTCMYTIINLHVVQLLFFIHVMHIHHYNILWTFERVDSWYCVGEVTQVVYSHDPHHLIRSKCFPQLSILLRLKVIILGYQ